MTVLVLSPEDLVGLVGWSDGIAAMRSAFEEFATSNVRLSNPRTRTNTGEGFRMTVHQGVTPSLRAATTTGRGEIVKIFEDGRQRYPKRGRPVFILFDSSDAQLLAIMIGEPTPPGLEHVRAIGGYQTACCAAYCTDLVARPDARRVGVLGSGGQAKLHFAGLAAARQLDSAVVHSPTAEHCKAFAEEMSELTDLDVVAVSSTDEVIAQSEILLVCTNSNVPVLDGSTIAPGTHVTSIVHSNKELVEAGLLPAMRQEIDDTTLRRAGLVVTTSKAQEELDQPAVIYGAAQRGVLDWANVLEVAQLIRDSSVVSDAHERGAITFLHNPAGWGIGAGAFVRSYYDAARREGRGMELPIEGHEGAYAW